MASRNRLLRNLRDGRKGALLLTSGTFDPNSPGDHHCSLLHIRLGFFETAAGSKMPSRRGSSAGKPARMPRTIQARKSAGRFRLDRRAHRSQGRPRRSSRKGLTVRQADPGSGCSRRRTRGRDHSRARADPGESTRVRHASEGRRPRGVCIHAAGCLFRGTGNAGRTGVSDSGCG